jgi:hypothetical protein
MTSAPFDRTSLNRLQSPVDLHRMTADGVRSAADQEPKLLTIAQR